MNYKSYPLRGELDVNRMIEENPSAAAFVVEGGMDRKVLVALITSYSSRLLLESQLETAGLKAVVALVHPDDGQPLAAVYANSSQNAQANNILPGNWWAFETTMDTGELIHQYNRWKSRAKKPRFTVTVIS